jgi:hypothetical protein
MFEDRHRADDGELSLVDAVGRVANAGVRGGDPEDQERAAERRVVERRFDCRGNTGRVDHVLHLLVAELCRVDHLRAGEMPA